jgi:hypothetical protein
MLGVIEKFCPKCGYRIRVTEEKYCHGCGIPVKQPKQVVLSHEDVKDIPIIEKTKSAKIIEQNHEAHRKEFWLSGSYYLVGFSNVVTIGLVEAGFVNAYLLPIVLSGSLIVTAFLGACQLRHTNEHLGKSFSSLMTVALKKFVSSIFVGKV